MTFGRGNFGHGFNIVNEDGRPVVTSCMTRTMMQ